MFSHIFDFKEIMYDFVILEIKYDEEATRDCLVA